MKKFILKNLFAGIIFSIGFLISTFVFIKAAGLSATSGSPLTANNWNNMISNFFWGSGSGGIFYNGKVGIGTSSPNKSLHIKTSAGTNAELDIQSGNLPHWAIYQDEASQDLKIRNGVNKVAITNGGALNAIGGLCINGDCKTAWNQVGGSSVGTYQFTGSSDSCNSSNKGKIKYVSETFYGCDGSTWFQIASNKLGFINNPGLSCKDILNKGGSIGNGTYRIQPLGTSPFQVYCDMNNGGWTLVMAGKGGNAAGFITAGDLNTTTNYQGDNTFKFSDAKINAITKTSYKIQNFRNSKTRYVKGTCSLNTTSGALGDCTVGYRDEGFSSVVTNGNNGGSGYYGIAFRRGTPDVRAFIFSSAGWEIANEDLAATTCASSSTSCDFKMRVK